MTHDPDQNITTLSTSEETTILGEGKREMPADILKMAREFVAAEVSREYRYMYISGKSDGAAAIKAVCKAILAERERCARIAEGRSKNFDYQKALADHDDMAYGANTSRSEVALAIRGEA